MTKASVAAKNHAVETKGAAGATDIFVAKQEQAQAKLKATATAANGASIAMKALRIAGNMIAMWAVTEVIQLAAEAIDNYIHVSEKAIEKTEELKSKHEDLNSKYESHKKLVEECAESYEKLSKGVDASTNKNQSLSTEDYEEYLRITNELSEAFPSLYQTLDDNGNAILTLGQNGQSATKNLEALLEAEENLNNYKIAQDIDGLYGGVKVKIEEANAAAKEYQDSSAGLEESYNAVKGIGANPLPTDGVTFSVNTNEEGGVEYYNALIKILQNFYAKLDPNRRSELLAFDPTNVPVDKGNGLFDFFLDTSLLTEEEIEQLSEEIKAILPILQDAISDGWNNKNLKQQEADLAWNDFIPQLVAAMKSQGSFKGLAVDKNGKSIEFGEDLQNLAIDIVSNLDSSFAEEMGDDPYGWVRDNIILSLTNLDDDEKKEIIDAYNKLLELDPGDLSTDNQTLIDGYVKTIANLLGKEENEIKLIFGFDVDETYRSKYNATLDRFKDEETQSLAELRNQYQATINKRKELYSGEHYVGNVDINNRPVVINDDGSYSTTSTVFQEKWIGDEETGHYIIGHFTPILPNGEVLTEEELNNYIDRILSSDNPMEADKVENGGYGIVYKVDTEVNGQKITDNNLDTAFGIADAWDVEMHETQDKMYRDEAEFKAAIERFGSDSSVDLEKFFTDNSINTEEEIDYFNKVTEGEKTASEAIQMYRKAKSSMGDTSPSFTTILSSVQKVSVGLDQLDSIMADVIDGENFDWSSILNNDSFKEAFEGCGEAYDDFIKAISESPDDLSKCQSAFDKLATQYIYNSGVLSDLTEETKEAATTILKEKGIGNAEEVVNSMLQGYTEAMQLANAANIDFANATAEEIYGLTGLEAEFENAGVSAFNYYLKKKLCSESSISTVADCNSLIALAEQCQVTGKNIEILIKLRNLYNVVNSEGWGDATKELAEKEISKLKAELMETATVAVPKFTGGTKSATAAQNKLKDSTEKATEALEKQKEALEEELSELDELYEAVNWFYDKKIEKIDDSIDAINDEIDALEKQKDNLDDIIEAIERNYDAEISKIQEKIDALNDENDEQERAIALEEAKRKLQEAKNRKTVQVYTKNAGFVYQVDTKAIKEAEDELEELQKNEVVAELEKQIDKLEEAKEKWSEIPDAYNQAMQDIAASNYFGLDWKNLTLFPSDELLNNFKGNYTGIQDSIDSKNNEIDAFEQEKERIEELKSLWEDAKNFYCDKEYEKRLATFFGSDYDYQLLNNSATWRQDFAEKYAEISTQIEEIEKKIKAASEDTANSIGKIGSSASNSADKVGSLIEELEKLNGKQVKATVTVAYYQSAETHAKKIGKAYASGTKNATRGIHEVAEKGAEIVSDGETAVLVEDRTLFNMEGGETVYNARETKELLEGKSSIHKIPKTTIINGEEYTITPVTLASMYGWGDENDGIHPKEFDYDDFCRKYGDCQEDPLLNSKNFRKNEHTVQNITNNTNNSVTELHFNGDLSFPNIRSSDDAEKLIHELSTLSSKAMQRANRRR